MSGVPPLFARDSGQTECDLDRVYGRANIGDKWGNCF